MLSSIFSGTSHYARPSILALADGTVFHGYGIGALGHATGEVVFNTSMTGYQEILTDPSYFGQIVTLTYPHIGNTGVNPQDTESKRVQAAGLVVRDSALQMSNFRANQSLDDYLKQNNTVAIVGIDTRYLTRIIRDKGIQSACIYMGTDTQQAVKLAQEHATKKQQAVPTKVGTNKVYQWQQGPWSLKHGFTPAKQNQYHVVVMDFGVKESILRQLVGRQCQVTVMPSTSTTEELLAKQPSGILLSNGPGDPAKYTHAIRVVKELLAQSVPIFGICLGHQLLGHALGAKSKRLLAGHHGSNHPVQELATGKVYIVSQNHNYVLEKQSFTSEMQLTHISLFDRSVQGFRLSNRPVFGFQGHPEANPGPRDISALFDQFIHFMMPTKTA